MICCEVWVICATKLEVSAREAFNQTAARCKAGLAVEDVEDVEA